MKALSLFSGCGGMDLGLERAGITIAAQSEIDPYSRNVLSAHFPDTPIHGDVRRLDAQQYAGTVGLVVAGFPCQPVSAAGRKLAQDDERWLWPEVARIVGDVLPRWVLLENVRGLLGRGLIDVLGDLAGLGYDAEWTVVPASAVGAPHRRDRVAIVAYPEGFAEWSRLRTGLETALRWGRPGDSCSPPDPWPAEPDVGRVADGVPDRLDRLRALGNAVVPAWAEWIGSLIVEADDRLRQWLAEGQAAGFCDAPFCAQHDVAMSDEELEGDACVYCVRLNVEADQ